MARILLTEAAAWGEKTKLATVLATLDTDLLTQVENEVLGRLASVADTSSWVDSATTPGLVKTILAKLYVAWVIDRQYSEDEDLNAYATLLRAGAQTLLDDIISSEVDIPGAIVNGDGLPSVYPTDTDPLAGPYFRMDAIF
jgi:hypothetical protein